MTLNPKGQAITPATAIVPASATSVLLSPAGNYQERFFQNNHGSSDVYLACGSAAASGIGFRLLPGGAAITLDSYVGPVSGYAVASGIPVAIIEV